MKNRKPRKAAKAAHEKTCYLIDTASVENRWGYLLRTIEPVDEVAAFFDGTCRDITLNFINALLKKGAHITLLSRVTEHKSTVNLNFQLVTELGYRIAKEPNLKYILVSENEEYEPLIEYWEQQGVNISRYNIITSKPEEIHKSYNYRPNDPIRLAARQKAETAAHTDAPAEEQPGETTTKTKPETDAVPQPDTAEPDTDLSEEQTTVNTPVKPGFPRYASDKECRQNYYVRLNKLRIPAERSKAIAAMLVKIMQKPANQQMLTLYNALCAEYGKKSPFMKSQYTNLKMLVAEINRIGPLPMQENTNTPA